MSMSQDQVFESALSLPQGGRADLAFQLLQSLDLPGDVTNEDEFAAELRARVGAHRRGEIDSYTLDEARSIIEHRLAEEQRP